MSRNDDRLLELGRRIARELGTGPDAERQFFQQSAILVAAARRRFRVARFTIPVLATAGVVFGLLMLLAPPEDRFGFRVKGEQPQGATVFLQAGAESLPVDFDDGSRVEILAGSAARIVESSPRRVEVSLSSGTVAADIRRAGARSWSIRAGLYTVSVVGTEFSVSWAPERAKIEVAVSRGTVRVEGPELTAARILSAGERFSQSAPRMEVAQKTSSPIAKNAPAGLPRPAPPPSPMPGAPPPAAWGISEPYPSRSASQEEDSPLVAWRLLHHVGEYRSALAAVGDSFEDLLVSLGADDLWRLAETCRLARDSSRAHRALEAFRRRFPQSPRSQLAAFLLATVALDLERDPAAALTWFERYLEEAPRGPLAEEALGRSIQAALDAGRTDKARDAARRYLDEFPNGSYADRARALL